MEETTFDGNQETKNIGSGDSFYIPNFIESEKERDQFFMNILNEADFDLMFNFPPYTHPDLVNSKELAIPIPRLVIAQTNKTFQKSPIYRMPGCSEKNIRTTQWTHSVKHIKDRASELLNTKLNHCVITLFRNGQDSLGMHSDKIVDLSENSLILSVSLGSDRPITFDSVDGNIRQVVILRAGSLLAIGPKTNRNFKHGILRTDEETGPRISLSLRSIASQVDVETGKITGKGKKYQTYDYPFYVSYRNNILDEETTKIIERHRHEADLNLKIIRDDINYQFKNKYPA
jgi:alkylated DNA repair dioxygenase AlkB